MINGWDRSAEAWLTLMQNGGDFSRVNVLDVPMLERVRAAEATDVLDVGCGEGRFCRQIAPFVTQVTGLDPTDALLDVARKGPGTYVQAKAEEMPFADAQFDLVISYLSLIDIEDAQRAMSEMCRVLRPDGRLLIGNLNSWITASQTKADGWTRDTDGAAHMVVDRYLEEHSHWGEWQGMRIQNWHRPLAFYMQTLLKLGLQLTVFDEPKARPDAQRSYNAAPYLYLMEWAKPVVD